MKKLFSKMAILAAILLSLLIALPAQAASISVGNDTAERGEADGYENFTVIDTNHPVSANGWLTIFRYFALDQGPFRFVLVDASNKVQWVSAQITPPGEGVNVFTPPSAVPVQSGWNLGVYFAGTGTIPFESTGAPAYFTPDGWVEPPGVQTPAVPTVGSTLTYESNSNRTYSFVATGEPVITPPPQAVSVTVVKYLDGRQASATAANNSYFLMNDTWSDTNAGTSGSSHFTLGPVGLNTQNPYQATFTRLTSGAAYSLSEDTSQYAVGTTCSNGQAYRLLGYTTGNTLAQAAGATRTATAALTNITSNKFIIVWNETCAQTQTIQVGNDTAPRPVLDTFGNFAIYDTNHPVFGNGCLTKFHYYAANRGAFRFMLVDGSDMVQWVSDEITPPGVGVNLFTPKSPVPVRKGWNVGLYFATNGTIPYEYAGAPAYYRSNDSGDVLPIVGNSFGYEDSSNRIYSFAATGVTVCPLPDAVNVTTVKYLDGKPANAVSANSNSFPMKALWSAANLNAGSDSFALSPVGVNNPNPYQATTPDMTRGAFYRVWEDTSQSTVGETCRYDRLYQLSGYTTGDTLAQAVSAKPTTKIPSLNNVQSNKFVIVWNESCDAGDDCHDNGHHYGNDKGDNHKCNDKKKDDRPKTKNKCKSQKINKHDSNSCKKKTR
jgi:hypothetical protein